MNQQRRPSALDYPPYLRAIAQERLARDAAFLDSFPDFKQPYVLESIAGFPARAMTLWHFLVLRIMRHPLLVEENPTPEQLSQFLWLLNPAYSPSNDKGRAKFVHQCRKRFYPPKYAALINTRGARLRHEIKKLRKLAEAAKVIETAKAYVREALQDQPATKENHGYRPDYYSDAAAFCAMFGREMHYSRQEVLGMPMKCLFQFLNESKSHSGEAILCNPSDSVKAEFYRQLNRELSTGKPERNNRIKEITERLKFERRQKKGKA
jgi:hypothetical protein